MPSESFNDLYRGIDEIQFPAHALCENVYIKGFSMVKILILTCMLSSICALTAIDSQTLQDNSIQESSRSRANSLSNKPRSRANSINSPLELRNQEAKLHQEIVYGTGEGQIIEKIAKFTANARSKSFSQMPQELSKAQ